MSRDEATNQLRDYGNQRSVAEVLTASNGKPLDSLTASMTTGERGPIPLKDFNLVDHIAHFDRERIPERVVHAKGAGALGYFEVTNTEITKYCRSKMFSTVGKRTPLVARFSTVGGESGSADTARDPRGFAVKFYTEEGNWDLVGNNTPIFFIRDPILFPSFIHTQKRNPQTHLKDPDMMWDFISLRPETTHQVSFLFSDRGTPDGYRHMNGYGSHTFKNVNASGQAVYVKYHFKTDQGIRNLDADVAGQIASSDPDYAIRDLYNSIAKGEFPSWTMYIQVMTFEQASTCPFNPFDLTKVWSHKEYPLIEVGRMVLNRNPLNYFAEVEQVAFAPSHMIPGIEPSPDKMLQGRLFSYSDTHRHRLGANYQQIPINCPFNTKARNYQRDGPMCIYNQGSAPNYFPNSFQGPQPDPNEYAEHEESINKVNTFTSSSYSNDICTKRFETGFSEDNFSQCGEFYRNVLDEGARDRLTSNIAGNLVNAQDFIQRRAIANFSKADPDYGASIEKKIANLKRMPSTPALSKPPAPLNPPRKI